MSDEKETIRQLRAEIDAIRTVAAERLATITSVCDANDAMSIERDKLRAEIAERDARIAELTLAHSELISNYLLARKQKDSAEAELARISAELGMPPCIGPAPGELSRIIAQAKMDAEYAAGKETELARLRAQGPVAWMWNDMIGIPHTHISPTRPTWPDAGASSAMSVAINVRPLYAEPMPAKVAK
jgi:hypothetical protein